MKGLKDKVVIVTGGAGGIGAAVCRRFGEAGAQVAVFDINKDAAEKVASEIRDAGGKAQAFAVDLTSQESVVAAVNAAEAALGPTDVLVNNAGWDHAAPFLKTDKPLWEKNAYASVRLLRDGTVPADNFVGSWSGAFGMTQFIPTSFYELAADGDGDGRIDLYNSLPDALASTDALF